MKNSLNLFSIEENKLNYLINIKFTSKDAK